MVRLNEAVVFLLKWNFVPRIVDFILVHVRLRRDILSPEAVSIFRARRNVYAGTITASHKYQTPLLTLQRLCQNTTCNPFQFNALLDTIDIAPIPIDALRSRSLL